MTDFSTSSNTPHKLTNKQQDRESGKYSKTVRLPETSFDQRANALQREPSIQKWWEENKIYEKLSELNPGEKYILHDGPPYANGDLHIGHAMNKILKDFINRYQILKGRKVRFVPGWDCHGLPIEMKVLQSISSKERSTLTPVELRKRAAEFAKKTMESQRKSFKRYGIWGDWDNPYLTLQSEYEAAQIRVFGEMVAKGHIYRGKKPVHWSPSSRTALAEAELEYPENHISRSIFVAFRSTTLSPNLRKLVGPSDDVRIAIWTTTPWTIPANLAVAVNGELNYCLISHPNIMNGAKLLVASDLFPSLAVKFGVDRESFLVSPPILGRELVGTSYLHPLYERELSVLIGGDYITTESGTGLVHTAPGHGQEDYQTGLKYGLPLFSPVNDLGQFTAEAGESLEGLDVLGTGNEAVINALRSVGVLIKEEPYNHKYPYDWRTKKPTIFRATEQWFASVSNFREDALRAIDGVTWIPAAGRSRIRGMTESRGDWCISRQRSWGVPIPVFYKKSTGEPVLTPDTLDHIENIFRRHGSDSWWEMDISDLLPEGRRKEAKDLIKGTDTMDVWFDSGTSWAGVLRERGEELEFPADLYLEGSDQSRGWFQSSLLTAVAANSIAPYRTVLTHGFVLDEKGHKMSKSLGNVVDPMEVIAGGTNQKENPPYGADTLRMWVSFVDYTGDVCIGSNIMKQVFESYRKVRNTLRYLLGSVHDFDPVKDKVPYDKLPEVDKYMLGTLSFVAKEVEQAYEHFQFFKVNHLLVNFATVDLSAFYLDSSKDRLYISEKTDLRRRTCQTVIHSILEQFTTMLAPILPHLAEEVWQHLPYSKTHLSIFQKGWISGEQFYPLHNQSTWNTIRALRNEVNYCVEKARQAKVVGANMECCVHIHSSNDQLLELLRAMKGDDELLPLGVSSNTVDDLRFLLMVSEVIVQSSEENVILECPDFNVKSQNSQNGITIGVKRAQGRKCERCWYYCRSVGKNESHLHLCSRCVDVVSSLDVQ